MISMSYGFFITWIVWAVLVGVCIGVIVMYAVERKTLIAMFDQCEELRKTEQDIRTKHEEYVKTRDMIDTIDNIPEYLRDKYDIPEKQSFSDDDEDFPIIYT